MMVRGEYEKGKTAPILAKRWKLSVQQVEKDATEAKRQHQRDTDKDARRQRVGDMFDEADKATRTLLKHGSPHVKINAARVHIESARTQAELGGLAEPIKIQHFVAHMKVSDLRQLEAWKAAERTIVEALRPFPEAKAAVLEALRAAGDVAPPALPGGAP